MPAEPSQVAQPLPPGSGRNTRFSSARTVAALILREMSTTYGRSPGGYLWAILEPLAAIIILGIGFSFLIRNPPLGSSFFLFYATGYLPFNLYQVLALKVARSIGFSRPLLMYPAVTWVDAIVARFVLNALTSLLVAYVLMVGILQATDSRVVIEVLPLMRSLGLAMLLGLGIGTLNCALMGLLPVWDVIWSVVTRPLFLASGIFFLYDDLPQLAQDILWYNPLVHIVGLMRESFYPMYHGLYVNEVFVLSVSLILLSLGLLLLGRYHRDILNS